LFVKFMLIISLTAIWFYAKENQNINKIRFIKKISSKNPPYLKPVIDPILKVKITRITDYKRFQNSYPKHRYAKNQPFNCDSSLIKLQTKWLLDGNTYKIIKIFPKSIHFTTSIWSHKNPDILYIFRDDGKILQYNVKTDRLKEIFFLKNYDRVTLGPNEGNMDLNDKYVALACKRDKDLVVEVLDLKSKKAVSKKTFKNRWGENYHPLGFDWVSISPSGEYIVILWNKKVKNRFESGNVEVFKRDFSKKRVLYNYGNHGDICFNDKGEEMYVQFAGKSSINGYFLKDNQSFSIFKNKEFEIGSGRFISCRNYKRKGWCYVSSEKNRLIAAISLDGNKKVEYFTNHNGSQANYKKAVMAVPNPTGEKVLFSSDWGDKNQKVVYEYIAEKIK